MMKSKTKTPYLKINDLDLTTVNNIVNKLIDMGYTACNHLAFFLKKSDYLKRYPYLILDYRGKLGAISNITDDKRLLKNRYLVNDVDRFLDIAEQLQKNKQSNSNQPESNPDYTPKLEPGMVVEYKNGKKRLVVQINNVYVLMGPDGYTTLASYKNDLTHKSFESLNIDKVFTIRTPCSLTFNNILDESLMHLVLIWERQYPKINVTLQEIANKFNIKVNQINIVP